MSETLLYKFEFKIRWGLEQIESTVILNSAGLFKAVQEVGDFHFRCTILNVWNITGCQKTEIPELRNIAMCTNTQGTNYKVMEQIIKNSKVLQRQKINKRVYKSKY